MQNEGDEGVVMSAWAGQKRKYAHPKTKKCEIAKDHIKRMPDSQILPAFAFGGGKKFLF